jgi:drug/metabolite transporter (DMT)-like permease
VAWLAVCISWGTTFLATRIALESFPPFTMAGSRHVFAGVLLAVIVRARGLSLPPPASWPTHALLGALMISVGNGTLVWAQQFVPSGLAAVMVSMIPFWMVGIDALMPGGAPMHFRQFTGLALGFAGITLLTGTNLTEQGPAGHRFFLGVLALQTSCLGWALGSAISKRRPIEENIFGATALQMIFGGAIMMLAGVLLREWPGIHLSSRSLLAVLYLIVFGSFVGYISYVYALKHLPVSTVSLYAYVNPVIAVILGRLLLDEPFSARMALGIAVIFVAMLIVRQTGDTSRS